MNQTEMPADGETRLALTVAVEAEVFVLGYQNHHKVIVTVLPSGKKTPRV